MFYLRHLKLTNLYYQPTDSKIIRWSCLCVNKNNYIFECSTCSCLLFLFVSTLKYCEPSRPYHICALCTWNKQIVNNWWKKHWTKVINLIWHHNVGRLLSFDLIVNSIINLIINNPPINYWFCDNQFNW